MVKRIRALEPAIATDYVAGHLLTDIAARYAVSQSAIYPILRRQGVAIGERKRRVSGERLRALWQDPAFREAQVEKGRAALQEYHASPKRPRAMVIRAGYAVPADKLDDWNNFMRKNFRAAEAARALGIHPAN